MLLGLYAQYTQLLDRLRDIPLLAIRLILAYGFYDPAMKKISNFNDIVAWFGTLKFHFPLTDATVAMPFPYLNAVMATATETVGFVLLTLGFLTRIISVPLMFVMLVAISTVHLVHGYACGSNGFEVPFYYFWMLSILLVIGPGKFSVDHLIASRRKS